MFDSIIDLCRLKKIERPAIIAVLFLSGLFQSSTVLAQEWADLKVTFVYDSDKLPVVPKLSVTDCKLPGGVMPDSELLIIDPKSKGIANMAFYPDTKKKDITEKDIHPDLRQPPEQSVLLDNLNCMFVPHVFFARAGQKVTVKNSDNVGHAANFNFMANQSVNSTIPAMSSKDFNLTDPEKAPMQVLCTAHRWMISHILILDHPYAGISDKDGAIHIEKLPANKPILFKVWHENMEKSIDEVTIGDKKTEWKKGQVELTLKPGMNDLGKVKIGPTKFKSLQP